jgi:3'-5' exoribonuclease
MKRQYIRELAEGQRVSSVFALSSKELRTARSGSTYLSLELADRTGRVGAVLFEPTADALSVPVGTAVEAVGITTTYRGTKRVRLDSISPAEADASDLIAAAPIDPERTRTRLRELVEGISDAELRRVLKAVFGEKSFLERFMNAPGSQSYHHAYVGGLAAHTLAVAEICCTAASLHDEVNRDLLVTAALLHDIGKVDELEVGAAIHYTDEGRLIGHVVLGERRLRESVSAARARVSAGTMDRLSHALLSHHGELEWGAPKRPSTLEALLLHHADNLDAKAAGFVELMANAGAADERWTDAQNLFRRPLFVPADAQEDRPRSIVEDDQYHRVPA